MNQRSGAIIVFKGVADFDCCPPIEQFGIKMDSGVICLCGRCYVSDVHILPKAVVWLSSEIRFEENMAKYRTVIIRMLMENPSLSESSTLNTNTNTFKKEKIRNGINIFQLIVLTSLVTALSSLIRCISILEREIIKQYCESILC